MRARAIMMELKTPKNCTPRSPDCAPLWYAGWIVRTIERVRSCVDNKKGKGEEERAYTDGVDETDLHARIDDQYSEDHEVAMACRVAAIIVHALSNSKIVRNSGFQRFVIVDKPGPMTIGRRIRRAVAGE